MADAPSPVYSFGVYRLNPREGTFTRDGVPIPLTPKEFEMLAVLVRHSGHVVEKEELLKEVWPGTFVEEGNLTVHISALRRALGQGASEAAYIETVPRRGYRFRMPVEEVWDEAPRPLLLERRVETRIVRVETEESVRSQVWSRRNLTAAAIFLLLAAGAGAGWRAVRNTAAPPPPHMVPFTSYPGRVRLPAFSPDGEKIAFVWTGPPAHGNWDIYVKLIGSGPPLRLTTDPGEDDAPAWSPDGRQIAFLRTKEKSVAIFVIGALGGPERKLTDLNPGRYFNLQWTRDGKAIVFAENTTPQDMSSFAACSIFLLSVDTLEKRQLTFPNPPESDHRFAVSPDGKTLAFLRHQYHGVGVAILTVPLNGGQPKHLYTEPGWAGHVVWSADGRSLIFTSGREGGNKMWRIPADGGEVRPVSVAEESAYSPSVAMHGNRLAYVREYSDTDLIRLEIRHAGNPAVPVPVAASARVEIGPAFSPDGKRLAFLSEQSGTRELWLANVDGTNAEQMTDFHAWDTVPPTWSPDGKQLAFFSGHGPGGSAGGLFVMDVDSKQVRRLPGYSGYSMPQWSRDGKWIFMTANGPGGSQIAKIPAEGGAAVPITRKGGMMPRESPDGRYLYFLKGPSGIWRVPSGGGEESLVIPDFPTSWWCNWGVANDGIYFVKPEALSNASLQFYDFATHKARPLATIPGEPPIFDGGLSVSHDGKWIVYTQVSRSANDIMLVENFR